MILAVHDAVFAREVPHHAKPVVGDVFSGAIGSGGDNAAAGASRDRLNVQRIDRHDRISAPPVRIAKPRCAHGSAGERPCRHRIAEGNA
jgi:hypothetical protein